MGFWAALLCGFGLQAASPEISPSENEPAPQDLEALRDQLESHLQQARFRHAQWGIRIVSLETGHTLFEHHPHRLFIPASNTKLFTGALALDRFGPDYQVRTSLASQRPPNAQGVVKGDLWIVGRGDPTLIAQAPEFSLARTLEPLVVRLQAAGVRRIDGNLIADDRHLFAPPFGSGWNWDDLEYGYGAEVSALTLNDNAVEVQVKPGTVPGQPALATLRPATAFLTLSNRCVTGPAGSPRQVRVFRPLLRNVIYVEGQIPAADEGTSETVSVHRPAAWFGHTLRTALEQRGVRVRGSVQSLDALDAGARYPAAPPRELAALESPPLRELLPRMMKPSQNLHAQLLLLQVGAAALQAQAATSTPPAASPRPSLNGSPETAEAAGLRELNALAARAGIPTEEVLFEEGSGLSRKNLVTPAAIVQLLQFMDRHPHASTFRDALPVAGMDGTLRTRMRGSAAAGNAQAKTGSLRYVYALSGYVQTAARERLAFALILNQYRSPDSAPPARADLDAIVTLLACFAGRS